MSHIINYTGVFIVTEKTSEKRDLRTIYYREKGVRDALVNTNLKFF